MSFKFVIPGDPTPLARPRYSQTRVYDAQKHAKFSAGIILQNQYQQDRYLTGPLLLDITFFMPLPRNMSAKKKNDKCGQYHTFKPDLDNCVKFIFDVANNIIYKDDCIIAQIYAKKIYDIEPRTEFIISELYEKD